LALVARKTKDRDAWRRLTSVLRCLEGASQHQAATQLGMAQSTVAACLAKFEVGGVDALLSDGRRNNGNRKVDEAFRKRLCKILLKSPRNFGWQRTTWTRELLAKQMACKGFPEVSVATMGRALCLIGAHLRSPKPFVTCPWTPQRREERLAELRALVASCCWREPVYWEDEVDIHLNPKIGRDWTLRARRRYVRTPGKNAKHYMAGALHAKTKRLVCVDGDQKASWLFCNLARELCRRHPSARRIHLIIDNFGIHDSKITRYVLTEELKGKVVLHPLPPYCPDHNRIERVWLDLHSNVTRNHRCRTIKALMVEVWSFIDAYNNQETKPSLRRAA
jgi:transposase